MMNWWSTCAKHINGTFHTFWSHAESMSIDIGIRNELSPTQHLIYYRCIGQRDNIMIWQIIASQMQPIILCLIQLLVWHLDYCSVVDLFIFVHSLMVCDAISLSSNDRYRFLFNLFIYRIIINASFGCWIVHYAQIQSMLQSIEGRNIHIQIEYLCFAWRSLSIIRKYLRFIQIECVHISECKYKKGLAPARTCYNSIESITTATLAEWI